MKTGRVAFVITLAVLCVGAFGQESDYFLSKKISSPYEEVLIQIKEAVQQQGFGVVNELPMHKSLMERIPDFKMDPYIVLGICNAKYAERAIKHESNIGLFFPCKILVKFLEEKSTEVVVVIPSVTMSVVDNEEINKIADEVTVILTKILESI